MMLSAKLPLALLLAAAVPPFQLRAQDAELATRMRGFTHAVAGGDLDTVAGYFPRSGDWTWHHAVTGEESGRLGVRRWRFPGSDARAAIDDGGPLCPSFHSLVHGAPLGDWLVNAAGFPDDWRYDGAGRYVPTGVFAGRPVFVEWRREGTEWVVSAIGDHGWHAEDDWVPSPRVLGYPLGWMIVEDTLIPLADPPVDATATDWYPRGLLRYGRTYEVVAEPRALEPDSIRRFGMIGRVPVYRAHDDDRDPPEVLYVLTGPARTYRPYIDWAASEPCRRD